jgi:hypothetical protein
LGNIVELEASTMLNNICDDSNAKDLLKGKAIEF